MSPGEARVESESNDLSSRYIKGAETGGSGSGSESESEYSQIEARENLYSDQAYAVKWR